MINKCIIQGVISTDIIASEGKDGSIVVEFNLFWRKEVNNRTSAVDINCVAFDPTATRIANECAKGTELICEGRLVSGGYFTTKQGIQIEKHSLIITSVHFAYAKSGKPYWACDANEIGVVDFSSVDMDCLNNNELNVVEEYIEKGANLPKQILQSMKDYYEDIRKEQ